MSQSRDGTPRQRDASSTSRSSKADGVAVDVSGTPHETDKHCQDEELENIDNNFEGVATGFEDQKLVTEQGQEGPPDKKDVHRFKKRCNIKNPEKIRWRWSTEEDKILIQMVNKYGQKHWPNIARAIPGRSARQCLVRWKFSLDPGINKEAWSQEEELRLIRAHQSYGNKWCEMVKYFPGRTNHAIKEYWRGPMKRKLDSYLASGLLDQFPGLPETPSVPQNIDSDNLKNIEGSSHTNRHSSKSKLGLRELGGHADTSEGLRELGEHADASEGESSDFMYARGLDARSAKASERMMATSKQRVRTRRRLDFLSSPVELKVSTAVVNSQRPLQKSKQMSPAIDNISPSNVLQDVSPEVPSEFTDTALSPADSYQPSDVHSSETSDPLSLEVHQANVSDLLDMPYCDGLMIIPPGSPHDGSNSI